MKKTYILFICIFSLLLPHTSYGSNGVIKKAAYVCKNMFYKPAVSRTSMLNPKQIEKTLHKRVLQANKKIYKTIPPVLMEEYLYLGELPAVAVKNWPNTLSEGIYKSAPWLRNAGPVAQQSYFIALHNRLVGVVAKQRLQLKKDIQAQIPHFIREKINFEANSPLAWQAAKQVSPQVKQILIAEQHSVPEISHEILQFIQAVKVQNPNRKIVYLTEFIPQDIKTDYWLEIMRSLGGNKEYFDIFDWAHRSGWPVVGLEPVYVWENVNATLYLGRLFGPEPHEVPLWETLGGVYLRNLAWRTTIEKTRRQYPDALFIIHAGQGHVGYAAPYSVARFFAPEETFVLEVLQKNNTTFNIFSNRFFSKYPILGWKNKNLARLAGFDVRIQID